MGLVLKRLLSSEMGGPGEPRQVNVSNGEQRLPHSSNGVRHFTGSNSLRSALQR
jgi:hypothetical protein